jgi:hypothetical protein
MKAKESEGGENKVRRKVEVIRGNSRRDLPTHMASSPEPDETALVSDETCMPSSESSRDTTSMIFLCRGGRWAQADESGPPLAAGAA